MCAFEVLHRGKLGPRKDQDPRDGGCAENQHTWESWRSGAGTWRLRREFQQLLQGTQDHWKLMGADRKAGRRDGRTLGGA